MRILNETVLRGITAVVFLFSTGAFAECSIVRYCNVTAENVEFLSIVESSTGQGPMYGQPWSRHNTLVSSGIGFLAQSNAGNIELIDGRLQLSIQAEDGFLFDQISVSTLGSYFGFGDEALALVNSFATVEVGGNFFAGGTTLDRLGAGALDWRSDYNIRFPQTNQATLTLNTQLLASSGLTAASFIEASSIRISTNSFAATAVPEPSSVWWMAIALVALRRRRRRRD